jgi:hypothetical protein
VLGLVEPFSAAEARAAFRRLAWEYHPDRNREPGATERFQAVLSAYRRLERDGLLASSQQGALVCPGCGVEQELFPGADGMRRCADCLFGVSARRRLLPLQPVVTVKHLSVVMLYLLAAWFVVRLAATGEPAYALYALAAALAGLVLLAATCLRIRSTR